MEQENLIKSFIGKNADIIYAKMNKKGSFNIYCMLFTAMYFLYRKMYIIGIISYLIQSLIANLEINVFIRVICFVVFGYVFYPLYKMHINRKINKLAAKGFTEEDIRKKGGTSIVAVLIVPIMIIAVLITGIGMKIMDSALEAINNEDSYKYYSYNGAKIKYGNEWKQGSVESQGEIYKCISDEDNIVIICMETSNIDDKIIDYSIDSERQQVYDDLISDQSIYYSDYDISIINQSHKFEEISKGLYCAYYEICNKSYARTYFILDSTNDKMAMFMVLYDEPITNAEQEEINDLFRTIKF